MGSALIRGITDTVGSVQAFMKVLTGIVLNEPGPGVDISLVTHLIPSQKVADVVCVCVCCSKRSFAWVVYILEPTYIGYLRTSLVLLFSMSFS